MSNEQEQRAQRQSKLDELVQLGVAPYPHGFAVESTVGSILERHAPKNHDALEAERPTETTAGRIVSMRSFGKASFLVLSDGLARLQVYIREDSLPERDFQIFKRLDFGDWIGVSGRLFRTKTNELTIWASRVHFLVKCLLPLPEKWHGLT